ncbi:hypothetical protein AQUCO_04600001v1 [Aquilegia coerulea]|uniref:Cyclin C-terminal domain-containing protein n=1 Tax=Aquilegia coerulea TaxID=218851 RepID=A0A2G5CL72_AQUCA|nr:hypothetical protein AQUCO_04600001v1 [Aquilegia coerulea]
MKLEIPFTIYIFLSRYIEVVVFDRKMENMVFFFLAKLCLRDYGLICYSQSMMVALTIYVARCTLNPRWDETLKCHTGFSTSQLQMFFISSTQTIYRQCLNHVCGAVSLTLPTKIVLACSALYRLVF